MRVPVSGLITALQGDRVKPYSSSIREVSNVLPSARQHELGALHAQESLPRSSK
jgi:hypothetical protein